MVLISPGIKFRQHLHTCPDYMKLSLQYTKTFRQTELFGSANMYIAEQLIELIAESSHIAPTLIT